MRPGMRRADSHSQRCRPSSHWLRHRERGAAAFEYVVISVFAGAISVAAMAFLGKLVQGELDRLAETLDAEDSTAASGDWPFGGSR